VKKYQELVNRLSEEIAELKQFKQKYAELNLKSKRLSDQISDLWARGDREQAADLYDEQQAVEENKFDLERLIREHERDIDLQVQHEYELVPFHQTKQQGIAAFYREAGL
jgi:hypothetical protein